MTSCCTREFVSSSYEMAGGKELSFVAKAYLLAYNGILTAG